MNDVMRGEIYYISHGKSYYTDPRNEDGRPAVVVSCDQLNKNSECVEIVYLTSQEKRPMPSHVSVMCKVPSTAICETIYTVSKDRIGDFIRCCTEAETQAINTALACSLGIEIAEGVSVAPSPSCSTQIETERNLYKSLYEDLLDKVMAR